MNLCHKHWLIWRQYSANFSRVFNLANFANFQPLVNSISMKFLTCEVFMLWLQEGQWTTSWGRAAECKRDALQRDTFKLGIGFLTDASWSRQQCDRQNKIACHVASFPGPVWE